jgi:hypothetical protein
LERATVTTIDRSSPASFTDSELIVEPKPNYLLMMFEGQRRLMEKYHEIEEANGSPVIYREDEGDLDSREVQARLHQLYGYLVRELSEAMQELKNKPWKKTEQKTDIRAFVEEVGDVAHFFVEFCITAGISAKDLHDAYFRMHNKNVQRQTSEY